MEEEISFEEVASDCSLWDVGCWMSAFGDWLVNVTLWWPRKVYELFLSGVAEAIGALPVPDIFATWATYSAQLASGTAYFMDAFAIQEGVAIITGVVVAKWFSRVLPWAISG